MNMSVRDTLSMILAWSLAEGSVGGGLNYDEAINKGNVTVRLSKPQEEKLKKFLYQLSIRHIDTNNIIYERIGTVLSVIVEECHDPNTLQ